jgi:hypothetical protein
VRVRLLVITWSCALVFPALAYAHGGAAPKGYTSTVDHIVNARGVQGSANADGNFTFTAPAGHIVIVSGYSNEPFLRFADDKVYENENSQTVYVNRGEPSPASLPKTPRWVEVVPGRTYTWHDHRTHWMNATPPENVQRNPKVKHHIFDWTIAGTLDRKPFQIVGSLDWGPTKSGPGYVWISYIAIAGGLVYAAFLLLARRGAKHAERQTV